ncbi:chondroadherin-like [Chironomus tepperi]|uniref:chondroadherin-like n=1 Tax=Chironomus tepperi TaxID=113505 RepID=UPI00391FA1AD
MAKYFLLLIISILPHIITSTSPTTIQCKYNNQGTYYVLHEPYRCEVQNDLNIISPQSTEVSMAYGMHDMEKTNDYVTAFFAWAKNIQYFPTNLDKTFKNLKAISIWEGKLKEIHSSDLKPFPKLVELNLYKNDIEVLEEGLFDNNPQLELISFYFNQIVHVDSNIFKNLDKITHLWLSKNPCIDMFSSGDVEKVKKIIRYTKSKCISSDYTAIADSIEMLKNETKSLNLYNFGTWTEKLQSLIDVFDDSKFTNFATLKDKIQELRNVDAQNFTSIDVRSERLLEGPKSDAEHCMVMEWTEVDGNLRSTLAEALSGTEENLKSAQIDSLSGIKKEFEVKLDVMHGKIVKSVDEKIKEMEGRLTKKIEGILKEKLAELFKALTREN